MKVLIVTYGGRGDVQPFLALARALTEAGHEVMLGAPSMYASIAQPCVTRFVPFDLPIDELANDPAVRKGEEQREKGRRLSRIITLRTQARIVFNEMRQQIASLGDEDVDLLVHHNLFHDDRLTERLGVPTVPVILDPAWIPTPDFTNPILPFRLPRSLNRASYALTKLHFRILFGEWRKESGLTRLWNREPPAVLQAFSRHLLPCASEYPDFPAKVHTTGYWFLPSARDWEPSQELLEFLAAGEPPVYVGFGSMVGSDPHRIGRVVSEAIRLAGVRAVVVAGRGGIDYDERQREILYLKDAPFDWLFPRMAVIVHHGGTGTAAAAVAAGRPQVVISSIHGTQSNARSLHASGVAHAPQSRRDFTAQGLAEAIVRAASDKKLNARANELGSRIRAEGGVRAAVKCLESLV